jgi:hypothetical protein
LFYYRKNKRPTNIIFPKTNNVIIKIKLSECINGQKSGASQIEMKKDEKENFFFLN